MIDEKKIALKAGLSGINKWHLNAAYFRYKTKHFYDSIS
jgi:hypothetical protein